MQTWRSKETMKRKLPRPTKGQSRRPNRRPKGLEPFIKEKVSDRLAFQRIPPNSQMDLAKPHGHLIIHKRESASML